MKGFLKKIIPIKILNLYYWLSAFLPALLKGFPGKSAELKIIGVTGTSGKTTVVDFISRILEEAGHKTASLSSARFRMGNKEWKNELKMTMPSAGIIQKFLKDAIENNCRFVVIEVTSEGIRQFRHKFINFDTAVFTNLSPEHIESHKGFENYKNEKLKLFNAVKNIHVINLNDKNAKDFLEFTAKEKWGYSTSPTNIEFRVSKPLKAIEITESSKGVSFKVNRTVFDLKLFGIFNVYNALASLAVGLAYGVDIEICKNALEKVKKIPGRMEFVVKNPFKVIVDYAHTPVQLESVYKSIKNMGTAKMICVLGSCGGGRDKWKRPILGKIALKYCNEIYVTNEDPYDEDPEEIIKQVAEGAKGKAKQVLDRKEAIKRAVQSASANDAVIITGKGCEPWMCVKNNKKIEWDDRQIVKEAAGNKM